MMTSDTLAAPVSNVIKATNNHDTAGFLAQFTADAQITDWGHHYYGLAGVQKWNATDNIGANASMQFISAVAITRDGLTGQAVSVKVKSEKFSGQGLIQFYLKDNLIQRIIIEP